MSELILHDIEMNEVAALRSLLISQADQCLLVAKVHS
jgi:hypothetical protein